MPGTTRTLVALAAALALVGAGPVSAEPVPERLEDIQRQIEAQRERLEGAQEESRDVREELAVAQERRQDLTVQVRELRSQLQTAQANLAQAQAQLDEARRQLRRWSGRLQRARDRLASQEDVLNQRAATAYILGPGAYLEILLGSGDLSTLSDRTSYVERVLTVESNLLEGVRVARTLVSERRQHVGEYEDAVTDHFVQVRERTEEIAALQAQQESALDAVDLEAEAFVGTLDDLGEAQERYEEAVAALEAESARISGVIQSGGSSGSGQLGGELAWPTDGPIVSGFGYRTHPVYGTTRFHSGVDIDGACGQPIYAAEDGRVLAAGYNGGYGNATIVDHGNGLSTLYAHQSSFQVSSGQGVGRGQQIGLVGTTGLSTGCHLHFEVRVNGEPVDPVPYLT
jgi:murein DD-endopeptidase MepM/ murein hydrolase activator NlpD